MAVIVRPIQMTACTCNDEKGFYVSHTPEGKAKIKLGSGERAKWFHFSFLASW